MFQEHQVENLPVWKAIVGDNMFAHESGIHADGAIKNPKNYEAFDPDIVGAAKTNSYRKALW